MEHGSKCINEPACPWSSGTLNCTHPAQRQGRDALITSLEDTIQKYVVVCNSEIQCDRERFGLSSRRRCDNDGSEERGAARTVNLKCSPFRRRNSTSCVVSTPQSDQGRETISHMAFERVRALSLSPPPARLPLPCVDISFSNETPEQYINRKLTERWSSYYRSRVGSPSASASFASTSSPPPTAVTDIPGQQKLARQPQHVNEPLAQEILKNIDGILLEHTGALRDVIEGSRRLLMERAVDCYEDGFDAVSAPGIPTNGQCKDVQAENSSVPDHFTAIDRMAHHSGLPLPQQHMNHPEVATAQDKAIEPPILSWGNQSREEKSVVHGQGKFPETYHSSPRSVASQNASSVDRSRQDLPVNDLGRSQCSLPHKFHHSSHHSHRSSDNFYAVKEPEMSYTRSPRAEHQPRSMNRSHMLLGDGHEDGHEGLTIRTHLHELEAIEHRSVLSASPALLEYDRFAALADRASRNSMNDIVDTAAINGLTGKLQNYQQKDYGKLDNAPPPESSAHRQYWTARQETTTLPGIRLNDSQIKKK
ncbi:uncharacterized protein PV09_06096 [Verruconis gallopava]|uniref:Uncharacterized protein n=1 Tax=Verruconis gallopava TaxID=253628 RepID=A0A0D2A7D4_9PEZI|nr:uncharacterized protein PV09_06096 [Verruconis gallopava]KIW02658.1 hypothetical protein PV09_06096 [Verruconis gallopava]